MPTASDSRCNVGSLVRQCWLRSRRAGQGRGRSAGGTALLQQLLSMCESAVDRARAAHDRDYAAAVQAGLLHRLRFGSVDTMIRVVRRYWELMGSRSAQRSSRVRTPITVQRSPAPASAACRRSAPRAARSSRASNTSSSRTGLVPIEACRRMSSACRRRAFSKTRSTDRCGQSRGVRRRTGPGAGGVIIPPATYWPEVARICDERGILLVTDEVICGFGRLGEWFGADHFRSSLT